MLPVPEVGFIYCLANAGGLEDLNQAPYNAGSFRREILTIYCTTR